MERGKTVKVLLDTTILIDILNQEESAIQKIEELKKTAILYTATINIYEVWKGVKRVTRNREKYERGLRTLSFNLNVISFDLETAEKAADIYAELAKKGIVIDEADYIIAGCCLSNSITMILTKNEKHFEKINGLKVITY